MAPHNAYRCEGEQRWCAIACEDDAQWRALAALIGRAVLADHPRFATLEARKTNEAELDSVVESWTSTLQAEEAMRRCQAAGVAAGVVRDCEGLFGDPQLVHRGHYVWVEQAEMGAVRRRRQLLCADGDGADLRAVAAARRAHRVRMPRVAGDALGGIRPPQRRRRADLAAPTSPIDKRRRSERRGRRRSP